MTFASSSPSSSTTVKECTTNLDEDKNNDKNDNSIINVSENDTTADMKRLESQLQTLGIANFSFVPHEQSDTSSDDGGNEDKEEDVNVVHVKTLIWELVFEEEEEEEVDNEKEAAEKEPLSPRYVITAIHANHRVNQDALLSKITQSSTQQKTIKTIQLAPQKEAELLSGYKSGTIPPICHSNYNSTWKLLYLDQGIFKKKKGKGGGEVKLSFGSGSLQHSLLLSYTEFKHVVEKQRMEQEGDCPQLCICCITNETTKPKKIEQKQSKKPTQEKEEHPKKHISKRLRDAAGKKGKSDAVLSLIQEAGPSYPSLMTVPANTSNSFNSTTTTNFPTKNALHLAAWKGDIASIQHLISAGKSFQLDLLNTISTGIGNYGKTPIFYAITQNRNDVVQFLLEEYKELNLLIVNNKGQSPSSMACSHLDEKVCEMLYAHETRQLERGEEFVNYRHSHSDKKQYGDLDPRFSVDEENDGKDVQEELQVFCECMEEHYGKDSGKGGEERWKNKIIPKGVPRTLRLTTIEKRKERADVHRKNAAAAAAAMSLLSITTTSGTDENTTTETTSTGKRTKKKRPNPLYQSGDEIGVELKEMLNRLHEKKKLEQKERKERKESLGGEHDSNKKTKKISKNEKEGKSTNAGSSINFDKLETLTISHIFPGDSKEEQYEVIHDLKGLKSLEREVLISIRNVSYADYSREEIMNDDEKLVHNSWGLDCEWKPSRTKGSDNPIATLQLCSNKKAFLVDLQTLCQPIVKDAAQTDDDDDKNDNDSKKNVRMMNKTELFLSQILSKLFSNPALPILGFGLGQDILKLAASFPHITCFHLYHSVIDLHEVSRLVYRNDVWKKHMASLRKTVAMLIGKVIDKKEQCSEWDRRPLTESQICYAILDSAVLRPLLSRMLLSDGSESDGKQLDRREGSGGGHFLASHPELRMSVRFTLLDQSFMKQMDHPHDSYCVEKGRVKKAMDFWFARQSWPSEDDAGTLPALPERLDSRLYAKESVVGTTVTKKGESGKNPLGKKDGANSTGQKQTKTRKNRKSRNRQKAPIMILDVPWEPKGLPSPGDIVGYMKENCVERIIGQAFLDSMPESTYLSYNRRGGVVELANAWVLFVNFGVGKLYAKYRNEFRNNGQQMTFYVKPHKVQEASLLYYLSVFANVSKGHDAIDVNDIEEKKIFLFVRPGSNSKFMYCGKCECKNITVHEEEVMLLLDLVDYDELVVSTEAEDGTCDYINMVGCHQQHLVDKGESAYCFSETTDGQPSDLSQTEELAT